MHVQTGTATMAYTAVPLPASPTLTNPDMILPYGEYDIPSPPRGVYRSGSPNEDWDTNPTTMQFSIGNSHAHMGLMTPTTPIIYGNGTMLSDIGEVTEAESTPGRKLPGPAERRMLKQQQHQNQTLRSSPTIGYEAVMKRAKTGSHQRKVSIESTSTITSEAQHGELFKDFDDSASVDDSVFQGDDEESVADSSVADSYVEEVIASETKRLNQPDSSLGKDEDRNSSAALSRRAEQILLNAKKRLNNMEGNLTRARSSLYITPTGSMSSIHSSSPLARSTPSPQNETGIIPALGVPSSKHRQLNTPSDSPTSSPGHTRVFSENSISSPLRTTFPARSASAAARYMGKGGLDSSQPSPPLSSRYTPEAAHEESRAGSRSGFSSSLSKASPPHGTTLEPLTEDDAVPDFEADRASMRSALDDHLGPGGENRGLTRSASSMQMRDLRDQMQDLKGRLSVLRDRARDDTMKRRSLQSLRTPSPFTAAEQWYASSKNYGNSPPLSADAGVAQPPWNGEHHEEADTKEEEAKEAPLHAPGYANSDVTSVYEDVVETHASDNITTHEPPIEEEDYDTAGEGEHQQDFEGDFMDDYNDEMVNRDEADDYDSDASQYHDSVATQISHEDREDAFDYEHFFLHSAMGTISQQRHGRRDSVGSFSSEDSVETTRGPPAPRTNKGNERVALGHFRSESTDSVSTMATFATAIEGTGSENGEEDGADFSVQEVTAPEPEMRTSTPITAKRTTFGNTISEFPEAIKMLPLVTRRHSTGHDEQQRNASSIHRPSVASFESFASTGTTRSFPLVNRPKIQELNSSTPDLRSKEQEPSLLSDSTILTDGNGERLQPSPVHMLAREDQILVERLVASLGKCVLGLQEAGRASYEGRVWRRRLDAARRVLEGQEGAI